ncbi:gamma-glutamyltransferase [Acidaminobacter sp. JC074]|uniref:gamma-glutamyltransferase n=1 Tax=Acidaminobacter sp. JC074 TaxID=2530199 RepID=UPI001F0D4856|nr:gamma-glutamyltransferase [Acidaminobacter sp. JC074]MCH4887488.1 gamma-glutamyltransferase [Acidaminobacter sp. JC074]
MIRASGGMVSTARKEATDIGVEIIKKGGNAIDAAVAVGFALGVCEPNASGLGGGGFMTLYHKGQVSFIDFREIAPKSARPSMWSLDEKGNIIDDAKSEGGRSICVPGEVPGLLYALEKHGSMSIKEVIQPAIDLCRNGFVVSKILKKDMTLCSGKLEKFKEEGNPYLKAYQVGDIFYNEPLAQTLEIIRDQGLEGFNNIIGKKISESVNKHSGHMTVEDIKNFKVNEVKPIKGTYRGYDILSSPPPSSGGTHIIEILNILENYDFKTMDVNSEDYIHILSEAFKLAFADRQTYMGDPNFCKVPLEGLTSKAYGKSLADKITPLSGSYSPGNVYDYEPKDTTHYSIGDSDGNMVSVTKTISAFFGSGVVPENTGIVLNCQMRGFILGEGKANSVGPHKKPLSSMSPTIILKDKKPFAILGSPGGNRIIPIVSQLIVKLIDYQMNIKEAIDSPRISDDMTETVYLEGRISNDIQEALKKRGHKVERLLDYDRKLGGVQGVRYKDNELEGAADPRRDGVARGY